MKEDVSVEGMELISGGNIKNLPQCFNPAREKYVRKVDASRVYPFGRHIIDDIAKKAGAIVSVRGCVAYDTERINMFLDNCRLPAQ
ncbi:MAG: hypothetical protein IJJ64_05780 [Butyrivibrio sp.]|nr:hypothetical protein [Butyrivibrio sp.]